MKANVDVSTFFEKVTQRLIEVKPSWRGIHDPDSSFNDSMVLAFKEVVYSLDKLCDSGSIFRYHMKLHKEDNDILNDIIVILNHIGIKYSRASKYSISIKAGFKDDPNNIQYDFSFLTKFYFRKWAYDNLVTDDIIESYTSMYVSDILSGTIKSDATIKDYAYIVSGIEPSTYIKEDANVVNPQRSLLKDLSTFWNEQKLDNSRLLSFFRNRNITIGDWVSQMESKNNPQANNNTT